MNKKFLSMAAAAMMLAACSENSLEPDQIELAKGPAVAGQTPVGFSAYTSKATTRGGVTGAVTDEGLQDAASTIGEAGFGVFAYYTDSKDYAGNTKPDFMYNQQVHYNAAAKGFAYEPVKYWPNEYGANAESVDQDKVSFFAYAPYIKAEDTAQGTVANATWGITGFSRNSAAGDPLVKYVTSFNLDQQVDLTWGTVASGANTWATLTGTGTTMASSQTLTPGKPWLDVEHPANIDQKMKFNFRHALAQLNIQIDVDADLASHASNEAAGAQEKTKVYVRSITLGGIVQKGALNLNNETPNQPRWMNYSGQGELAEGAAAVVLNDGRKNGKEGTTANANEANRFLNANIISDAGNTTTGVTGTLQNLFNVEGAASLATATDDVKREAPVYVIPNTEEPFTITIVYDVETEDDNLSGYLSDGKTPGSSIQNTITKEVRASGLAAGNNYRILLHLGLNSVKFDAQVTEWSATPTTSNAWLPSNTGEGVYNPENPLSIISSMKGSEVVPVGLEGANATAYTISGLDLGSALLLGAEKGEAVWTIDHSDVALIAAVTAPAITRADEEETTPVKIGDIAEESWTSSVTSQYIVVKPLKKGTATISSNRDGDISTIVITVDASEIVLSESSVSLYTFSTLSPVELTATIKQAAVSAEDDTWADTAFEVTLLTDAEGTEVESPSAAYATYFTIEKTDNGFKFTPENSKDVTATVRLKTKGGAFADVTVKIVEPSITVNKATVSLKGGKLANTTELTVTTVPALKDFTAGLEVTAEEGHTPAQYVYYEKSPGSGVYVIKGGSAEEDYDGGELTFHFKGYADEGAPSASTKVKVQAKDPGLALFTEEGAYNTSEANALALRRVLVSDVAKSYASVDEAQLWGHSPIAIIAYAASGDDAKADSHNYGLDDTPKYYKYLAMAVGIAGRASWLSGVNGNIFDEKSLENLAGTTFANDIAGIENTAYLVKAAGHQNADDSDSSTPHNHPAAEMAANYSVAAPATSVYQNSGWFLPAAGQWKLMLDSFVEQEIEWKKVSDSFKADALNEAIGVGILTVLFGGGSSDPCWSSSEYSASEAIMFTGVNGYIGNSLKNNPRPVRPVFAF